MQSLDPASISQKILTAVLPEFMHHLSRASSLKDVQQHCLALCQRLVSEAWQDHRVIIKSTMQPQSEAEETKDEKDFASTIMKECTSFIEALRRYEL